MCQRERQTEIDYLDEKNEKKIALGLKDTVRQVTRIIHCKHFD